MAEVTNQLGQPVGVDIVVPAPPTPSLEPMLGRFCEVVALDAEVHGHELFEAFAEAADDGDWTYLPYGPFTLSDDFDQFLDRYGGLEDPVFFTIIDTATGLASGVASYLRIDLHAASIEVGHIHFSRRIQRKPAATEAMYLMMKRAFETGYRRYEWKCDALNAPSKKAAQRLGFCYEGEFRNATHYKGRNRDTAWFSIIDTEWPAIQAEFERWLAPGNFDASDTQLSPLQNR